MTHFTLLLRAVLGRNALFQKQNALLSVKTFKTTCCLGGVAFQIALNLEELGVKIHKCALKLDFIDLFPL